MTLKYVKKQREIGDIWSFFFEPTEKVKFAAGQYMNLTMPRVPPAVSDRLFSIASAPHEQLLQFTTIIGQSLFKQELNSLISGELIEADQLGGDFVWEEVKISSLGSNYKRLFVAGGIGITPYLSMVRDLIFREQPINATLLYAGKHGKRPFVDELHRAAEFDQTLVIKDYSNTRLSLDQLKTDVPDIERFVVYLAGSQPFCETLGEGLFAQGMPRNQIKYDYFDGYADLEY
jgi:ferredoxin-NADP reductase